MSAGTHTGYRVIVYLLDGPYNKQAARAVMSSFTGRGWARDRRPDLHTFGNVVLTFEPVEAPEHRSTLARGNEIEHEFYVLKAQEWAVSTDEARRRIEEALK